MQQVTPVILVGEAPGASEARITDAQGRAPGFVGASGIELLRMMNEAGVITFTAADAEFIRRYYNDGDPHCLDAVWRLHPEVYRTNVFSTHPPGNHIEAFCGPKKEGIPGYPALLAAKYVRAEHAHELDRLGDEVRARSPNLILALGNTALWALCGLPKISKLRGSTRLATHTADGFKVLPIYHPAAVLRQWDLRPTTIIDLGKAKREAEFPDVRRPHRQIWIEPSIEDIIRFKREHIDGCELLSTDIETAGNRITCIGFAPRADLALVVPFDDERAKGRCYWSNLQDEIRAWNIVKEILEDRSIPKLFHNAQFDVAFLLRSMGLKTLNMREDSMLLHHALMPEALKGLGYLGSLYTDQGSWKTERRVATTVLKKDG